MKQRPNRAKLEISFSPEELGKVRAKFGKLAAKCARDYLLGFRVVAPTNTLKNNNDFIRTLVIHRHSVLALRRICKAAAEVDTEALLQEEQIFHQLTKLCLRTFTAKNKAE